MRSLAAIRLLIELADAAPHDELGKAYRDRFQNQALLQEYALALTERAELQRQRPVTNEETLERDRRIADAGRRVQLIKIQIEQRTLPVSIGPPPRARDLDIADVQARIPEGAVLLEMMIVKPVRLAGAAIQRQQIAPSRYGLYAVRRSGSPVFLDLGEVEPLDDLITRFRKVLARPSSVHAARDPRPSSRRASDGAGAQGAGDATTLLIAPKAR